MDIQEFPQLFMVQRHGPGEYPKGSMVMRFRNGYKVSVVYGVGMYSEPHRSNYYEQGKYPAPSEHLELEPAANVEVAIFDPNENFILFSDDQQVKGHVSPDELVEILMWVKNLPPFSGTITKELKP